MAINTLKRYYFSLFSLFLFQFITFSVMAQNNSESDVTSDILELLKHVTIEDTVKVKLDQTFENNYAIRLGVEATKDELIYLTSHENPVVRFYALYYLTQNFNKTE